MSAPPIFKICPRKLWEEAQLAGVFAGSADDKRDGFIHFSSADQLRGTAERHFAGQTDLLVLTVDPEDLGEALRWEPSRGGDLFPHLYRALPLAHVLSVEPFAA